MYQLVAASSFLSAHNTNSAWVSLRQKTRQRIGAQLQIYYQCLIASYINFVMPEVDSLRPTLFQYYDYDNPYNPKAIQVIRCQPL